jgi:type I restriction enzyme S subunit
VNYDKSSFGEGIKVINVGDFGQHLISPLDDLGQIRPEGIVRDEHHLRDGDILFVRSNGNRQLIGRSLLVRGIREPVTHSAFTIRARITNGEALPAFYAYLFRTPLIRDVLSAQGNGANISNLNQGLLSDLTVPCPPLPVQSRIVKTLSAYDDLVANNRKKINVLDEMARSLFREWFAKYRFPGHDKTRMVNSTLGEIPEGWVVRGVKDVVKRIPVGKRYDNRTVEPVGIVPVLDQGQSGVIGFHNEEPGVAASEDAPVIVFANHTCYQRLITFPFSAIQNVLPFVSSSTVPRSIYWLHWATNGLVVINDYKGHWPEFVAKNLVVPPQGICKQFEDVVAPVALQVLKLERAIKNLLATRDLILPRLISGEIDVSSLPLEPAAS